MRRRESEQRSTWRYTTVYHESHPTLTSPPAGVPAELADLFGRVETCCNRAAGIVNAAARAVWLGS